MIARISLFLGIMLFILFASTSAQQENTILDNSVEVRDFRELAYPAVALHTNIQGIVVVRVKLDDQGNVIDATALSGAPALVQPSIDNAKTWRFQGNSSRAAVLVFNFRIEGLCFSASWSSQMIFYPPNFATITTCAHPAAY
jgi:TonB family protein